MPTPELLYPFLIAILPVVRTMARHPGQWSWSDAGLVLGALFTGCTVLQVLLRLALRGRTANRIPSPALMIAVIWFYSPRAFQQLEGSLGGSRGTLPILAVLVSAGLLLWLPQSPRVLDRVSTFLTLTASFLVGWFTLQIVVNQVRAYYQVEHSALARELAIPVTIGRTSPTPPRRDIYLIVLDRYAHPTVLREHCGFSDPVFEDSLRALGFSLPRAVWSNYSGTSFSLPSLLNFRLVNSVAAEVGPRARDYTLPNHLLEYNRTVAFLKAQGYRFLFLPSQWWPSTRHNRNADMELRVWRGLNLGRELSRSYLWRAWHEMTVLELLRRGYPSDVSYLEGTFAVLKETATAPGPKFVFAHVLSPHPPYVFTASCGVLRPPADGPATAERILYLDQIRCLNGLVLDFVTEVLRRSSVPPIILLQGDHGTGAMEDSCANGVLPPDVAAKAALGAFGAYYLPAGGDRTLSDTVTLVNLFRSILIHYFGASLPFEADGSYLQGSGPFVFKPVDSRWLHFP